MNQPASKDKSSAPERDGRIPRPAIAVVIFGLVVTVAVFWISRQTDTSSLEIEWDAKESLVAPDPDRLGNGSLAISRVSLAALSQNEYDELIYRVAGTVRINSGGRRATRVRCDVFSEAEGETGMARSTKLRAAWPKPSEDLIQQDVPETAFVNFWNGVGSRIDLPIRDVARRYTDIDLPVEVAWESYTPDNQYWIWSLPDGSGAGTATLPFVVIFEAENRPKGRIACSATAGPDRAAVELPFRLQEWPVEDDQPNGESAETGDVSNVE